MAVVRLVGSIPMGFSVSQMDVLALQCVEIDDPDRRLFINAYSHGRRVFVSRKLSGEPTFLCGWYRVVGCAGLPGEEIFRLESDPPDHAGIYRG